MKDGKYLSATRQYSTSSLLFMLQRTDLMSLSFESYETLFHTAHKCHHIGLRKSTSNADRISIIAVCPHSKRKLPICAFKSYAVYSFGLYILIIICLLYTSTASPSRQKRRPCPRGESRC